jgi:hypothetical protein
MNINENLLESAAVLSAFAMATVQYRKEFRTNPFNALLSVGFLGACYTVVTEVALDLLPGPTKALVPVGKSKLATDRLQH